MWGPACTVVREGEGGEAFPYPDSHQHLVRSALPNPNVFQTPAVQTGIEINPWLSALAHKFDDVFLDWHFLLFVPSGDTGKHSIGITHVIVFAFTCTKETYDS